MTIIKLKSFATNCTYCCEYFVGEDVETSKLYLFRKLQIGEEKWYLSGRNDNYFEELKAVLLLEVKGLSEGERKAKELWGTCKIMHERMSI